MKINLQYSIERWMKQMLTAYRIYTTNALTCKVYLATKQENKNNSLCIIMPKIKVKNPRQIFNEYKECQERGIARNILQFCTHYAKNFIERNSKLIFQETQTICFYKRAHLFALLTSCINSSLISNICLCILKQQNKNN